MNRKKEREREREREREIGKRMEKKERSERDEGPPYILSR
jgi:hypothetical protein